MFELKRIDHRFPFSIIYLYQYLSTSKVISCTQNSDSKNMKKKNWHLKKNQVYVYQMAVIHCFFQTS